MPSLGLLEILVTALWIVCPVQANYHNITLPWGTWQAAPLQTDPNIYVFRNVRFGVVSLRFGPSMSPRAEDSPRVQDSTYGPSCIQIDSSKLNAPPTGYFSRLGLQAPNGQSEDCLFLDVYVPAQVYTKNITDLPVVVWFYGGAYAFGSKHLAEDIPLYTGEALLRATNYKTIFVAGNYRLGAFGWLAGNYMESAGLPNAGLYDQRLLLEWVQEHIHQVGGDKTTVSAWGESAGAGSILHHLVREGGGDPLFSRALIQSPGFQWQWDNSPDGTLDQVYKNFSKHAGCGRTYNITCLREASTETLAAANQKLFKSVRETGIFPMGPSVDGKWIRQIPPVALANKAYWPNLTSLMISHVLDETGSVTPRSVNTSADVTAFLARYFPEPTLSAERLAIQSHYNCTDNATTDYWSCLDAILRDSAFTCNTRYLHDAYSNLTSPSSSPSQSGGKQSNTSVYMMQYSFPSPRFPPAAPHASDLLPTFMNSFWEARRMIETFGNITGIVADVVASELDIMSIYYQSYLASFALYGDPNLATRKGLGKLGWPVANGTGERLKDVMDVHWGYTSYYGLVEDELNRQSDCKFWTEVAQNITIKAGHGSQLSKEALIQQGE